MASKPKTPMSIENRAKQFLPFAALKGLPEALAAKERIIVDRPILSEESLAELDRRMHLLKKGKIATVIYYQNGAYVKLTGMTAKVDPESRYLQIVNTKIYFDDILSIEVSE